MTDLLRPDLLNGGDCDVYLCGPPPMIDAANAWLVENDMGAEQYILKNLSQANYVIFVGFKMVTKLLASRVDPICSRNMPISIGLMAAL